MDNTRDKRQRERNPITGAGMIDKDSRVSIPHLRPQQPSPIMYGSTPATDFNAETCADVDLASEEELLHTMILDPEMTGDGVDEMTSNGVPNMLAPPKNTGRQKQRDRNPITGDGMADRDYRATVPSFKIHGPQRKEGNPLNFEGYARDDRAYTSDVQEASVSPLTREEKPLDLQEAVQTTLDYGDKPSVRQRQRDRNPITGFGMEDRDFRVQIPTFKIHGPQRQSGDPLTGAGYAKNDNEYQRRVQNASESPLSAPNSPGSGGN